MFDDRDFGVHGSFAGWVGNFATLFTSVFLGVVLAGVLLGLMARAYLHWSAAEAVERINSKK